MYLMFIKRGTGMPLCREFSIISKIYSSHLTGVGQYDLVIWADSLKVSLEGLISNKETTLKTP